jgi:CBS domain containing-hemolysin-like protein
MSEAGPRSIGDRIRAIFRPRGDGDLRETIEELIADTDALPADFGVRERELLRNIFKLRGITAHDVMVPRADIVAVAHDTPLPDLVKKMVHEAHSRLPVFRETLDDIIGLIHIKDVLQFWGGDRPFKIDDILRRVLFVAPSMRVLDLLLEMRKSRVHMALVVDEYGGIDGLVTIENLDEHDVDETPGLTPDAHGAYFADARLPLEEFEAKFGPILTSEEREADLNTLGGLVVARAGRVPSRGEVIVHPAGIEFEVLDADPRRLKKLRVRRVAAPAPGAPDTPA